MRSVRLFRGALGLLCLIVGAGVGGTSAIGAEAHGVLPPTQVCPPAMGPLRIVAVAPATRVYLASERCCDKCVRCAKGDCSRCAAVVPETILQPVPRADGKAVKVTSTCVLVQVAGVGYAEPLAAIIDGHAIPCHPTNWPGVYSLDLAAVPHLVAGAYRLTLQRVAYSDCPACALLCAAIDTGPATLIIRYFDPKQYVQSVSASETPPAAAATRKSSGTLSIPKPPSTPIGLPPESRSVAQAYQGSIVSQKETLSWRLQLSAIKPSDSPWSLTYNEEIDHSQTLERVHHDSDTPPVQMPPAPVAPTPPGDSTPKMREYRFLSAAHFAMREYGRDGRPYEREGLVVYEGMQLCFDATDSQGRGPQCSQSSRMYVSHGAPSRECSIGKAGPDSSSSVASLPATNFTLTFDTSRPPVSAEMRLQLLVREKDQRIWHTITLPPIRVEARAHGTTQDPHRFIVKGYSPALVRLAASGCGDFDVQRTGTVRFGHGPERVGAGRFVASSVTSR